MGIYGDIMGYNPVDKLIQSNAPYEEKAPQDMGVPGFENDQEPGFLRSQVWPRCVGVLKFFFRKISPLLIVVYSLWCAALYFAQTGVLFPAATGVVFADPMHALIPIARPYKSYKVQRLTTRTAEQGVVYAYYVPIKSANKNNRRPVVIYFHGNSEIACQQNQVVQRYHKMGISVLLPEYRGYGLAKGYPSQANTIADCLSFYNQLIKLDGVDKYKIIIHGKSIGGAFAAQLAARLKIQPAALILQSTPANIKKTAWDRFLLPGFLVKNPLETDVALSKLKTPVLLFHGVADKVVPYTDLDILEKAARNSTSITYRAGHHDVPPLNKINKHWASIQWFLKSHKISTHYHVAGLGDEAIEFSDN